ncbi:hypothetical protein LSAT2_004364, partial [Lamellibrachia satsuma]
RWLQPGRTTSLVAARPYCLVGGSQAALPRWWQPGRTASLVAARPHCLVGGSQAALPRRWQPGRTASSPLLTNVQSQSRPVVGRARVQVHCLCYFGGLVFDSRVDTLLGRTGVVGARMLKLLHRAVPALQQAKTNQAATT